MTDLKEDIKRVVDKLIDSSMLKDCVYVVAIAKCCRELDLEEFTAERIIKSLIWDDSYYYRPHKSILQRVGQTLD